MAGTVLFTFEELHEFTSAELQEYASHLYGAACEEQYNSQSSEHDSDGHCSTTVKYVKIIRDVCSIIHGKGNVFADDLFVYLFPVEDGTRTADIIDRIFTRYFYRQCPGTIVSTMVAVDVDNSALIVTTFSPDTTTREAQPFPREFLTAEGLRTWSDSDLQRFRKHLYKNACNEQLNSAPHDRSEEGHCYASIEYTAQIGEVVTVLHERGTNFRNDSLEYIFPRLTSKDPAGTISDIFHQYFTTPDSKVAVSTRIAHHQDERTTAVTIFQSIFDEPSP